MGKEAHTAQEAHLLKEEALMALQEALEVPVHPADIQEGPVHLALQEALEADIRIQDETIINSSFS